MILLRQQEEGKTVLAQQETKLYTYKEAATYVGISEEAFLQASNIEAKLAYRLLFGTRVYTQKELDRYKQSL